MQRAGGFEPDPKVGVVHERGDDAATRLHTEVDEAAQRLPARPGVGVAQRMFEQWSQ